MVSIAVLAFGALTQTSGREIGGPGTAGGETGCCYTERGRITAFVNGSNPGLPSIPAACKIGAKLSLCPDENHRKQHAQSYHPIGQMCYTHSQGKAHS